jgi:DNA-binding response OmpR family regulator
MRVLLVEDHRAMREMIADHLKERGFAVDAVGRGDHAIAAAAVAHMDAVILDLGLPDIDGMQVLASLRASRPELPASIRSRAKRRRSASRSISRGARRHCSRS